MNRFRTISNGVISRSVITRRGYHTPADIMSCESGLVLNRLSGTAQENDYNGHDSGSESDLEFDKSSNASPIIKDISKERLSVHGGQRGNISNRILKSESAGVESIHDLARRGRRSKRREENYKLAHMVFDGPVRVRIMDVDAFSLEELHHYFMYTMVRRYPAEQCVKLAARIALFRDKNNQRSFECMSRDVADMFGPVHGPELSALFSRCFNTIPIAFMLDYIRRFGRFSRKFIAHQVDKTMKPRLFDFIRYPGGVKPLPGIVTKPFSLRSFAQLLPPCSAKKYIFQHLLARTGDVKALESIKSRVLEEEEGLELAAGKMDPLLGISARVTEKMTRSFRPKEIEQYHSDAFTLQPVGPDDIVRTIESEKSGDRSKSQGGLYEMQFTQIQPFKSPLLEDSDALAELPSEGVRQGGAIEPSFEDDQEGESWYACNRTKFFRHDGKAYRMVEGEGWKQVADPRGELPDYGRSRAFRNKEKSVTKHYNRSRRMKIRKTTAREIIRAELGRKD